MDNLVDVPLEHRYLTTPARRFYLASFLYLASLGNQGIFLAYPHNLNAGDLC